MEWGHGPASTGTGGNLADLFQWEQIHILGTWSKNSRVICIFFIIINSPQKNMNETFSNMSKLNNFSDM